MAAEHHHAGIGIGPGDFGNDVEGIGRRREFRLDVEFQLHGDFLVEQAGDAIVVLVGNHHGRDGRIFFGGLRAGADHGTAIGAVAGSDQREHAFVLVKLVELSAKPGLGTASACCRIARGKAEGQRSGIAAGGVGRNFGGGQFRIREAVGIRSGDHLGSVRSGRQDEFALQLAFELRHIVGISNHRENGFSADRAVCAEGPRLGESDDRLKLRLRHHRDVSGAAPAGAGERPFLHPDVRQAPIGKSLHGPIAGLFGGRGTGEPRTVYIGEVKRGVHDL